ncbi:hypothetical protein [Maribacter sp. HTCC2170]|uniref:hypothetical protein n=1 Tax=Maribacter sp. (strain HTCC2170 / KCCM 42371) TaxID=313603 RepID=UPI00006B4889|nr:hypothetical protein [Maribacter sp. HTCC2170]EAR01953.1 hypothetical membrane spanning protein [Maribacter sp. HTCC2170]
MDRFIEFKKQRELGEILSDTFAFLRLQFKPFVSTYFKIVGPYLVVLLIAMGFYLNSFSSLMDFNTESSNEFFSGISMLVSVLVFMIALIMVYATSQSTVLHYIKSYTNHNGIIDFNEIKKEVYGSLWSFIGLGIIVVISIMVGFIFCFLPGIYLAVPLSLSFSIMVFMKKGIGESYSYGFNLVKDEWWITFATLFVVGIIVGIAGYAFSIPAVIYQYAKMGIFSGEMDAANMMDSFIDPIYMILNMIGTLAQVLLNLITIIAGAFIYFNLNEKKNFTGTFERIQNLGKTPEN